MPNILADPTLWEDLEGGSPPSYWSTDDLVFEFPGTFSASSDAQGIIFTGDTGDMPESMTFSVTTGADTFDAGGKLVITISGTATEHTLTASTTEEFTITTAGASSLRFDIISGSTDQYDFSYSMDITLTPGTAVDSPVVNCDCDDTTNNRTLKSLRDELARRMGWGAQVAALPPGVEEMLNSFLVEAQELLYRRYNVLRTERFFSWPLTEGVRLYDLPDNAETCTKELDPRKVTWVGAVRDGIWYPLACGIDPRLYSHDVQGYPERYEIRQCIEIWPAPEETAGSLVIKGHFGLEAFAVDADKVTIDDRAVFLLALANAKAHYRQPDAQNYVQQLEVYIADMVAGAHHTRRYVPGARTDGDGVYVRPEPSVPFT